MTCQWNWMDGDLVAIGLDICTRKSARIGLRKPWMQISLNIRLIFVNLIISFEHPIKQNTVPGTKDCSKMRWCHSNVQTHHKAKYKLVRTPWNSAWEPIVCGCMISRAGLASGLCKRGLFIHHEFSLFKSLVGSQRLHYWRTLKASFKLLRPADLWKLKCSRAAYTQYED